MTQPTQPTNTYPATHVRVETDRYLFAHGRTPRGRGTWAFEVGAETWWAPANLLFTEAKRLARKHAGSLGHTFVTVAT